MPREWHQRRSVFWKNRERDRDKVVFLGDSIFEKWSRRLHADFKPLSVANRGICGDTTRGILFRMREDAFSVEPRALVLLAGVNDLDAGSEPHEIAVNVRAIVEAYLAECRGPVMVCTVTPHDCTVKCHPKPLDVPGLNYWMLAELTKVEHAGRLKIADTHLALSGSGKFDREAFADFVHPNTRGYQRMSHVIRPWLQKVLW